MAFAPTVAKVGNLGEDLDEGRRLCYHKSLPSDRVLVHAGRARQAGSHVEQNPLTCFGPVVQPHLRKLNDLAAFLSWNPFYATLRTFCEPSHRTYVLSQVDMIRA